MFSIFGIKKNKEIEAICARIDSNVSNNYKDAAQIALKELEEKMKFVSLTEKQQKMYEEKLKNYRVSMKTFTHKDQKPYWT